VRAANSIALSVAAVFFIGSAWRLSALLEATPSALRFPPPASVAVDPARNAVDGADARPWLRPLFSQPAAQTDSPADITGTTPDSKMPKLVGVVTDGDRRMAVIAYGGTLLRVDERHKVGSWTVVRIDPHSALLQDEQTSFRLDLDPNAHRD
jgi:hypothetical protein